MKKIKRWIKIAYIRMLIFSKERDISYVVSDKLMFGIPHVNEYEETLTSLLKEKDELLNRLKNAREKN